MVYTCAIPQQPTSQARVMPRPTLSSTWRRWSPKKTWGVKVTAGAPPLGNNDVHGRNRRTRLLSAVKSRHNQKKMLSAAQQQQHRFCENSQESEVESTMAYNQYSDNTPLLDVDDRTTVIWSTEAPAPRRMRNTRCRVRRLLRLNRHHQLSESNKSSSESSVRARNVARQSERDDEIDVDSDMISPARGWAYNMVTGLAWYMPSPFDMMPQGYPSRMSVY
ncbi:uncharacterized protein CTRU02_200318 [Colletotrichum truncatum]|uniref:Uncharacterized protein n=1 Tax=Colletotrichum truncatum TaxID=5467 RepID=A0ACC3ZE81_COLTU|nr:uncharacterized protein CTRU02_00073 [Colletotrichum truncatum]KAF6801324.1 hypothetical protein CTRU02_00073 [Colletotrichum truncatum]